MIEVSEVPPDPILGLTAAFRADSRDFKVNLGVGAFRTDEGKPFILQSVRQAEEKMLSLGLNHEYAPMTGVPEFNAGMLALVFGSPEARVNGMQAVGGTCALRLAGELIKLGISDTVAVSNPSWPIHRTIYTRAGLKVTEYRYFDGKGIDFEGLREDLGRLPTKSAVVLQVACHNPTGCDLSIDQWKQISDLMKEKQLLPILDFAYQGFGDGVTEDAAPVRLFYEDGHDMLVCSSCSKSFGLYGQRVGHLSVVTKSKERTDNALSQLKAAQRGIYSTRPIHGGTIVGIILHDKELKTLWESELRMRERIQRMRQELVAALGDSFQHMSSQRGMFSYTGLLKEQVERLRDQFGVYMPGSGRVNIAGLNPGNLEYVVDSIKKVV